MPSRRSRSKLVLFSSEDPRPVVNWLCENYGLQEILQAVAQFRPAPPATDAPAKRAYKKRGSKKRGSKKQGGAAKKGGRKQSQSGAAQG
jgi:hypothetical protein